MSRRCCPYEPKWAKARGLLVSRKTFRWYHLSSTGTLHPCRQASHLLVHRVAIVARGCRKRHVQGSRRVRHRHGIAGGQSGQSHSRAVVQHIGCCHRDEEGRGRRGCFPLSDGIGRQHADEVRDPTLLLWCAVPCHAASCTEKGRKKKREVFSVAAWWFRQSWLMASYTQGGCTEQNLYCLPYIACFI